MKTTEQFAEQLLQKHGLTLTSQYLGAHKPVSFLCSNNHENSAAATNVLQRGYKCKECITGHKVISKILWTQELENKMLTLLESKTTKEVAELLYTTVSAINNKLAELGISNSIERLARGKLISALQLQNRTLVTEGAICSHQLVTVVCSKGHTAVQQASNITSHNTGCPQCFTGVGISKGETELLDFIKSIYSGWIELKDRKILKGKELDIILPDLGIAIEYNGTYWHREDKVGTNYHLNKTEEVESFDFQLLHIKDYDWSVKQDIVKSMLRSKLGLITNKIYARKCDIRSISFPKEFLNVNHIQGAGQPTSENYGLFYLDTLVAVATFAAPRYDKTTEKELIRYCSLLNTNVVGGLSKLLSKIIGSVITYANRDYSTGKAYLATGFTLVRKTAPGLEYYKRLERLSRYKAQSMTPEELAGYTKYYNSGNLVFYRG